ncbi:MAG: sialidase family protein, partial [Dehalococcoidia bacterium]
DFSLRGGYNTSKYAFSFDNGQTWTEGFVPLNGSDYPVTSDGYTWEANSDPVVAIGNNGNVFLVDLYFNASNSANGLYVGVGSITGGAGSISAGTAVVAPNLSATTSDSEDKPWLTVDNSATGTDGNVYVSWTHFAGSTDYILVSRSADHGNTWTTPVQVSPTSQNGAVQGSQVAVGPDGTVYVAYEVFYVGNKRQQYMAMSTDGGTTFSAPVAVTPLFNELSFNSTYRKNSFPAIAADPTSGDIFMVYSDQPSHGSGAEVEFVLVNMASSTFTAPLVINDVSSGQQFMPSIAVDDTGVGHSSWFDTRNSPRRLCRYRSRRRERSPSLDQWRVQ